MAGNHLILSHVRNQMKKTGIPPMRWLGLGIGVLGVLTWFIGAYQIGLIGYLGDSFAAPLSESLPEMAALQPQRDMGGLLIKGGLGSAILIAGTALIYWSASIIRKN